MVLGGMALVLSRLIDNSVVVLENIFRHFEMGEEPVKAAEEGGKEVQLAVLAATFSTAIVFFPWCCLPASASTSSLRWRLLWLSRSSALTSSR